MTSADKTSTRLSDRAAELAQQFSDRRTALKTGVGAIVGAGAMASGWRLVAAQDASAGATPASPTNDICVLTAEMTEGPYYLSGDLIRKDITEGRAGVPLKLKIGVLNPDSCSPVENVAVDIWHCDALGYYSGVAANAPGTGDPTPADLDTIPEDNFLRGIQITDADGMVEFDTIYPGWYAGRAIHIHLKVHVGGSAEDETETYEGGHTAHTGQLFFDETTNDLVFQEEPYSTRVTTRLANDQDNILGSHDEEPGFLLSLTQVTEGTAADGYIGAITLGVDPDVTQAASAGGGGGQPGGPGGNPPGRPESTPDA